VDAGLGLYALHKYFSNPYVHRLTGRGRKAAPGSRPGKDFTKAGKKEIDSKNADENGGKNKCTRCGRDVTKQANKKGESTPEDQLQRHHKVPKSQGGSGTPENGEVECPACHQEIHNSGLAPQPAPQPQPQPEPTPAPKEPK
jgi:5-methylcytosine-specific restriction endonuclease McrA